MLHVISEISGVFFPLDFKIIFKGLRMLAILWIYAHTLNTSGSFDFEGTNLKPKILFISSSNKNAAT